MNLSGAQVVWECLARENVDLIFGFPGGAVLDLYHELPNYPIRHILVRHEQGAVHAADGYARSSGRVGVCLVTSGPGATNTVTGIATAYCDSIPMVILTGQVSTPLIGNDAFQEVDIVGITRPCTKHNYLVKDVAQLPKIIKQAFHLARSGRPGPVLIDLPKNVQQARLPGPLEYPDTISMRNYNPTYAPNKHQLRKALDLMEKARRPLFYTGGGVILSNAAEELTKCARELSIPVTSTLMGLGGIPGDDPLFLGMLGMHGTYTANMAVHHCDLLIAVGARFDDRVTGKLSNFAPDAKIVHVDIDPTSIRKNVRVDVPIVADCRRVMRDMNDLLKQDYSQVDWPGDHGEWLDQIKNWSRSHPLSYQKDGAGLIKPQAVIEKIYQLTGGEAIIATEVGQNQMWAAQFYKFKRPRTFITSGGLGTMGYGLPAAIGAQLAFPGSTVIDVAGDGSIQMNIQELATAVSNDLPVKVIILNNGYLGMVRQWQELFYSRNYCATCLDFQPDFVKLAEAYGAVGLKVEDPARLDAALEEALSVKKAVVMDVRVDPGENVYPMVPAGSSLSEMLLL